MRYVGLVFNGKIIKNPDTIDDILCENDFKWLVDSEIEDADLEIKKGTIIWNSGVFYTGSWKYGIFKEGIFHGIWENGIFEGGDFKGNWKSGINLLI